MATTCFYHPTNTLKHAYNMFQRSWLSNTKCLLNVNRYFLFIFHMFLMLGMCMLIHFALLGQNASYMDMKLLLQSLKQWTS
jgi:hypothetical protein